MSIFSTNDLFLDELISKMSSLDNYYSYKGRKEVSTNPKEFSVEIPFSGLSKDEIKIAVDGNVLTIKTDVKKESGFVLRHKNRSYSYSLSDAHDLEKVEAKMENGLLFIRVPVKEDMKKPNFEVEIM